MTDLATQADELESLRSVAAPTLADHATELEAIRKSATRKDAAPQKSALGTDIENFLAGAGKGVVDIGRGIKQAAIEPAVYVEKKFPGLSAWARGSGPTAESFATANNASIADARKRDAELMGSKAGIAGDIAGTVATSMIPLSAIAKGLSVIPKAEGAAAATASLVNPATYKAAAASGALQGAVQPIVGDESRVLNAGIGAGAGMGGNLLANTVGRIAQPVANVLTGAHDKAVKVLESAGIPLDAAQKSGSAFLNKLRSSFSDNPFTAGRQADLQAAQRVGFNRAVLKTIGEDAIAATPAVMHKAETRINGVFKDVLDRNNVELTDPIVSRIGAVQAAASESEKKPIVHVADRIINSVDANGMMPGQIAYGIKKDLDRYAKSADSELAYQARQLRSTVMDAINGSLSGADKSAFSKARLEFSNMRRIEPTLDRLGNGDISPSKLANVMAQKSNRQASVYGKGDQELVDLAHSGNMLLPDRNPNSGTVSRAVMQVGLPLLAGGAEGMHSQDWGRAVAAAGGAYALPKAAQSVMNNPAIANYIARGMQGGMTPIRDVLLSPQTNPAIGGVVRRIPQTYLNNQSVAP